MAKIKKRSEFYSNISNDFWLTVSKLGLEDMNDDRWLELDEIPEFIDWLQAEYDKQKAGN